MATTRKNIEKFAKMIYKETGIEVKKSYQSNYGGWCCFVFKELFSKDMIALGTFIEKHFKIEGYSVERCCTLKSMDGFLMLDIHKFRLDDFMKNGKITDIGY
jgi:hypothetical protein